MDGIVSFRTYKIVSRSDCSNVWRAAVGFGWRAEWKQPVLETDANFDVVDRDASSAKRFNIEYYDSVRISFQFDDLPGSKEWIEYKLTETRFANNCSVALLELEIMETIHRLLKDHNCRRSWYIIRLCAFFTFPCMLEITFVSSGCLSRGFFELK